MSDIATAIALTPYQKMWNGEIPANDLFKSEEFGVVATLDAFPVMFGHTLVISEERIARWEDVPHERLEELQLVAGITSRWLRAKLAPKFGITRITSGTSVPHYHEHLLPIFVRGDAANVFDLARTSKAIDQEALDTVEAVLKFPPELEAYTLEELARKRQGAIALREFSYPDFV
jgi:diadenosine tetraphosphate (Ap4A) HIT family hydrolase